MVRNVKKIAVVIPKYGLLGGAEKFASELTEHLALNRQYDIHVIANQWVPGSDNITFHKIPIITFPKFLTSISFAYFTERLISTMNFDLVHAQDRIFQADIYTMHGIPHRTWVREIRKKHMSLFDHATNWVENRLLHNERCEKFLAVSTLAKEKVLQQYDISPEKLEVIHPGVDLERFQTLSRAQCRRTVRKQFGIDPYDIVILFVSMNFEIKGLDYIIDALGAMKMSHPSSNIKLLVVGKGNYKKYGGRALKLGIAGDVIFAGIQKENLEQMYLASDLFMMLSRFDTFGIAALEAMAASLPVIVSGNVGAKDLIREGINGFVIEDVNNTETICAKLVDVLNEEKRVAMASEAYKTALANTWNCVAKRVATIYEQILFDNPVITERPVL